jgi:uroporphyrinogen decarboxylase
MGHEIRFAIARGPLNIASFLMGTTEFMMATVMNPEEAHKLLSVITDFTIDWLQYQKELFPEIDGIFILDDIVGFVGDTECNEFVVPYLFEIFNSFESSIRFFHNDAPGLVSSPYLEKTGVNLFNFSHEHTINEIYKLAGPNVTLLGNLPPRDVLAAGTPEDVEEGVREMVQSAGEVKKVIWSCGGGMPPNVSKENIHTFYNTVVNLS